MVVLKTQGIGLEDGHEEALNESAEATKENYEKEISQLRKTSEDYRETLQRVQAEFENAGKRLEREKDDYRKLANAKLLEEFLPLADSMDEAVKHAEKIGDTEMIEGVKKVRAQLMKILEKNGARRIQSLGKKFDAGVHECLMTGKEEGKEDGIILEEFQKGYTINGKVLRPAKVKVNKIT